MKLNKVFGFGMLAVFILLVSCKDDPADNDPTPQQWLTLPEYDFPIFIGQRGGVVTTSLETFEVTGFLETGDPAAFSDTLDWKVLLYGTNIPIANQDRASQTQITPQKSGRLP